ncbi:MAG: DMT family transporter [Rhodobacteraceae bacterium]|nr:DMT family transporter [Paracoccaceae bacterium]
MKHEARLYAMLMLMGLTWGTVFPITKIAVSTGYKPFGIVVWQMIIGVTLSAVIILLRGQKFPNLRKNWMLFLGVAILGTLAPNYFSYTASAALPAGIMSIVIATVPLFAMGIALMMGFEKASLKRLIGAGCGAAAIVLIIGPEGGLPDPSKVGFVLLAIGAPLLYGAEANFLTWIGSRGLGAVQVMFGAMLFSLVLSIPLTYATGQFITPFQVWGKPEWAIVVVSVLNWLTYVWYVWLIGRSGPVFASQVAYLVTGWGVVISMVFLAERYSLWVWLAFGLMLAGIALVRPKTREANA